MAAPFGLISAAVAFLPQSAGGGSQGSHSQTPRYKISMTTATNTSMMAAAARSIVKNYFDHTAIVVVMVVAVL
jgi:hypothetical protein